MSSAGGQFVLLLWKNFVLQGRKKCVTVFEIIVPLFFACLLLMIRAISDSEYVSTDTTWQKEYPKTWGLITHKDDGVRTSLFYTPNNTDTYALMGTIASNINTSVTYTGFDSETALLDEYQNNENKDLWAAIVFTGDFSSGLPKDLHYDLRVRLLDEEEDRWRTELTYLLFSTFGFRNNDSTGGDSPNYYGTGFLTLQYHINKGIIETHEITAGIGTNVDVALQKMTYPPFLMDVLTTVLQTNLPLFLVLSFILNALQIAKNISYEKEKKLKESMKMMGLSTFMYWLSWFVKCFLYMLLIMALYTILLKIEIPDKGRIINYVNGGLLFVFLLCYAVSIIAFCFMISTFFSKANSAAFAAGILFFLTYFPYFFLSGRYETMSKPEKMAACLLCNIAMAFGCNTMLIYEGTGEGAQWNNFYQPGTTDDNFSLLDAMIMLLVDTVLYMLIAWYVDNVNPGEAGVAQPFWFPFMPSYWCGSKVSDMEYESTEHDGNDANFERDPPGAKVGISIRHLRKTFKNKIAVKDTTLNIFEGQITALLGHNGAGKTTTISMLTGFLEATSGTAIINGHDIRTDISSVRKTLGLCPQHNILFDQLTVEEHLKFFAKLKGCPSNQVTQEVEEMIKVLGMEHKRRAQSHMLSGGQKRKLSVGIALIADSKTVILDEPTSGMDPAARRQTWEILQKYRQGRTIILTTHFMDEADILGDRIAIMADGVVKCSGTSMFLKKLYGAGYHMVAVKSKTCNVARLTDVVQGHIKTATVESEISAEISYMLPFNESAKFEGLFTEIENRMSELGVNSFGTSATTMEEVFLKVGEGSEDDDNGVIPAAVANGRDNPNYGSTGQMPKIAFEEKPGTNGVNGVKLPPINNGYKSNNEASYEKTGLNGGFDKSVESIIPMDNVQNGQFTSFNKDVQKNTGFNLTIQQFKGMFIKKAIHAWRNKTVAAAQLLLPIIFTVMALAVEATLPKPGDEPSFALNLDKYTGPVTIYSDGVTATTDSTAYATAYMSQFGTTKKAEPRSTYATMDSFFKSEQDSVGISTFNSKYIVAGDFEDDTTTVVSTGHFNGQPLHSMPTALQLTMAGILKKLKDDTYDISAANYPLPKKIEDNVNRVFFATNGTGFTIAIAILFGMAFMATSFIIFLIKEKSVGAKHLQVVSGVGPTAFWVSTFLWDMINYLIPVLAILIVFAAFQTNAYVNDHRLGLVFILFLLYGWAVLPFVYLLHYLFTVPATGMVVVSMINLGTGLVFLLATYTLQIPILNTLDIGNALEWVFAITMPNYNIGLALMDMYTNNGYAEACKPIIEQNVCNYIETGFINVTNPCCFPNYCGATCFAYYDNYFAWEKPGIGREIVFLFAQGCFYFTLVLCAEMGLFQRCFSAISSSKSVTVGSMGNVRQGTHEDSDVIEETKRINETSVAQLQETDSLILKNVDKTYTNGFHAVKGVSCGIPKDECFGLLGQNGAGKTTTFKMMTGDESLSSGNAYLNSYSVKKDIKKVQQNLGYCPQFDALIDQMTGRETLYMYARLRGIYEHQIKNCVEQIIDIMMLRKHADKETGFYSGGNKRKLSTAIALIGDPPFIFLDEPTTGMDPGARRQLWNVLSEVRASGRTLILTSHSMEECDALCTRLVIMVNGQFVCLGSPQHLKNKYGHGYTLFCRMGLSKETGFVSPSTELVKFVKNTFPKSEVFDDNQGYVHFQIPDDDVKLAQIFGRMEQAKDEYNVEDYSVHQTTLEQIFLTFTQNQVAPKETKKKKCCCLACCM